MRAIALTFSLLAVALFATACGGPDNADERLADACTRQIKELAEEAGSTPTAKSTEDNLSQEELTECAGQQPSKTSATGDDTVGKDDEADATDEDPGSGGDTAEATELDPAARELFASTCGGCHALSDADTSGAVGPNLDETTFDQAAVRSQIENGGGGMPANLLEGDDADSVAAYVAQAAAEAK